MLNKLFALLVSIVVVFMLTVTFCGTANAAAVISWDYPGDSQWANITGYNIYYSNPAGDQFNKTLVKSDTSRDADRICYGDIEDKLHLQHSEEYTLYVTAFNANEESLKSNSVVYTREGYVPPDDNLPAVIIHISAPVTIIIGD